MKTKTLKYSLYILAIVIGFVSCKEDEGPTVTFQEEDRTEQQEKDKDSLLTYLSTHYYNSSVFESGSNHKYTDILITELPQDDNGDYLDLPNPDQNTLLIDAIETKFTTYLDVDYEYYILRLNQGGGEAPEFTDQVRVRYEGSSAKSEAVFDVISSPENFPMVGNGFTTSGLIRAWQLVLPSFNSGLDFTTGIDGVVNFNNYGLGIMFVPSGLAYFSQSNSGSSYDNLIFKFELLQYEEVDHDADTVPSYLEDLDGDLDVSNDDTDLDGFPNFVDFDDDGDGVSTTNEDIDGDGDPTNDIGANGIPKYLDPEETESNEIE
jgi:FKBP-type peptidyl-prolyl cis-trans isomerase FkpA